MTIAGNDMVEKLTRPIVGIENRTAQEVFDMMCDRITWRFSELAQARAAAVDAAVKAERERLSDKAINAVFAAEFPKSRWSCGRDESGIGLTLQRQQHWIAGHVRSAIRGQG